MRKMSTKGLTRVLQLRTMASLRKRLKSIKLRKTGGLGADNGVGLWYGLNDIPVSSFKGRTEQAHKGAWKRDFYFEGAFVGKSKVKGRQTIFKRSTARTLPIEEQNITIEDEAIVYIEDVIFDQVEGIFWGHFKRDLQSRVKYKIGAY